MRSAGKAARDAGVAMRDATTGEIIAAGFLRAASISPRCLTHARDVGGPALRALTFHERAALLQSARQAPHRNSKKSSMRFRIAPARPRTTR